MGASDVENRFGGCLKGESGDAMRGRERKGGRLSYRGERQKGMGKLGRGGGGIEAYTQIPHAQMAVVTGGDPSGVAVGPFGMRHCG